MQTDVFNESSLNLLPCASKFFEQSHEHSTASILNIREPVSMAVKCTLKLIEVQKILTATFA